MNFGTNASKGRRLTTIPNLAKMPGYCEAFTLSSLHHLVFNAKSRTNSRGETIAGNGLEEAGAILRIGRKVLIVLDRFDVWLMTHKSGDGEP